MPADDCVNNTTVGTNVFRYFSADLIVNNIHSRDDKNALYNIFIRFHGYDKSCASFARVCTHTII